MIKIEIEELKRIQLEILIQVRDFCDKNKLMYFLAYGTLLGAVRHKGYIPWDDDIDIMMPRKDYEIFINSFNGNVSNMKVAAPELDKNYYAPYANVFDLRTSLNEPYLHHRINNMGVKIDLFPIDSVPDDHEKYLKLCKRTKLLNSLRGIKVSRLSYYSGITKIKLVIMKLACSLIPFHYIHNLIMLNGQAYNQKETNFVDITVFMTIINRRFPKDVINNFTEVEFEGLKFKAPKDYDKCLKSLFGDYMKLPPVEKRIALHNFTASWK